MALSAQLNFLWRVVLKSGPMIAMFMAVYMVLVSAFAFLCMFVFGWDQRDFHNLPSAVFSMLRLSLGMLDFDYKVCRDCLLRTSPLFAETGDFD